MSYRQDGGRLGRMSGLGAGAGDGRAEAEKVVIVDEMNRIHRGLLLSECLESSLEDDPLARLRFACWLIASSNNGTISYIVNLVKYYNG